MTRNSYTIDSLLNATESLNAETKIFVIDEIIKPALEGDFAPLATFGTALAARNDDTMIKRRFAPVVKFVKANMGITLDTKSGDLTATQVKRFTWRVTEDKKAEYYVDKHAESRAAKLLSVNGNNVYSEKGRSTIGLMCPFTTSAKDFASLDISEIEKACSDAYAAHVRYIKLTVSDSASTQQVNEAHDEFERADKKAKSLILVQAGIETKTEEKPPLSELNDIFEPDEAVQVGTGTEG